MSKPVVYEGLLSGLVLSEDSEPCFEGVSYDTPADEAHVLETLGEALREPARDDVKAAQKLVFSGASQHTAQLLVDMAAAYSAECGDDGTGVPQIVSILQEAARRIAIIEALSV